MNARLSEKLAPLSDYLEEIGVGERAEVAPLREALQGLEDLSLEDVSGHTVFADSGYQRIRLSGNDQYEVILMCWKPGQASPIHDHANSTCGVKVISGTGTETWFENTKCGLLRPLGSRDLHAGEVCVSQDSDIHVVGNYEDAANKLCTLHIYSPPLLKMQQYLYQHAETADFVPSALDADDISAVPSRSRRQETVYLNNAATTWPKPKVVYAAIHDALNATGSLGRTAGAENPMEDARKEIADFLGIADARQLAFVPGCTYASNAAILGLAYEPGDKILTSSLEHNATSRPARLAAEREQLELLQAPYRPGDPMDLDWVEDQLKQGRVKLVSALMASNVTGEILPYRELRDLTRRYGALLMLDAAQTAGVLPIDVAELQPDLMTFAGHKGLYGPTGIGLLYVAKGIEQKFLVVGGTGKDSGKAEMSARMPDQFEVGTHNSISIAGLQAGVRWVQETGGESILNRERALTQRFQEALVQLDGIHIYGTQSLNKKLSIVSATFAGRRPIEVSEWLARQGVTTRAGFHCSPMAHQAIGSHLLGGTVRFSFGFENTNAEIDATIDLVANLPADLRTPQNSEIFVAS